ncbi:iron transporter [Lachnospiraceae bacterium ZAX-1]
MKKTKKSPIALMAITLLAVSLIFGITGCSSNGSDSESKTDSESNDDDVAAAPGDVAGFEEFDIGDEIEVGPLNVAGVYFQPVDMEPAGSGLAKADSDMHIEADISALEKNDLGYGAGDFIPFLTVKYEILDADGNKKLEGNFMPMNASDGPHYGANINLGEAGKYKVRFIIESPTDAFGYLLHVDKTTGVEGRFWTEPLVAEWDFNYVPHEW